MACALTSATAGSGVVSPNSLDMPLAPMTATSMTNEDSIWVAQEPTVARVRPRTRPPSRSTVFSGFLVNAAAVGSEAVSTVSGRSAGSS